MIKLLYKKILPAGLRKYLKIQRKKMYGEIYLKGDTYYCHVCDSSFKRFLPKGNGLVIREKAECPNCGSLERTRLLKYYLENETNIQQENKNVLHIAPEDGLKSWIKTFKSKSNYINGDILPENADEIMDITQISYSDKTFDIIICSHVLGHVPEQDKALNELYRCLKPKGEVLLLTLLNQKSEQTIESSEVLSDEERLELYGEFDLVRLHGKKDLISNCEKAGFKVDVIDYRTHFSLEEQTRFSLGNGERELIFKLTKDE